MIGFLVLCGLPASGKTALSKIIEKECLNIGIVAVVINYDEHVTRLIDTGTFQNHHLEGNWRLMRDAVYQSVKSNVLKSSNEFDSSCYGDEINEGFHQTLRSCLDQKQPCIIIIDDNMYYRSMRYPYYQLAKSVSGGFCEVYICCSATVSKTRNAERSEDTRVHESVIDNIEHRMELPDVKSCFWEDKSITIPHNYTSTDIQKVLDLIHNCLNNPVLDTNIQSNENKLLSQKLTSDSLLQQSDMILRQIVSETLKHTGNKSELESLVAKTRDCKKRVLDDIKSGCICIPVTARESATDASRNKQSELYSFLSELFHSKLL